MLVTISANDSKLLMFVSIRARAEDDCVITYYVSCKPGDCNQLLHSTLILQSQLQHWSQVYSSAAFVSLYMKS